MAQQINKRAVRQAFIEEFWDNPEAAFINISALGETFDCAYQVQISVRNGVKHTQTHPNLFDGAETIRLIGKSLSPTYNRSVPQYTAVLADHETYESLRFMSVGKMRYLGHDEHGSIFVLIETDETHPLTQEDYRLLRQDRKTVSLPLQQVEFI